MQDQLMVKVYTGALTSVEYLSIESQGTSREIKSAASLGNALAPF